MGYKEFLKIDKSLLPIKVHYFLFYAATSCVLPFRAIFAKQLGISATAVGVIFLVVPFMQIVTNPIFGLIVDYFKKFRLVISLTMVFLFVNHIAMLFVPSINVNSESRANNSQGGLEYCPEDILLNDNVSYFQAYSQLESTHYNESLDFSCKINCNSQSSPEIVGEISACTDNITLQEDLDFAFIICHLKQSFADESVIIVQNFTKHSVKMNGSVLNFGTICNIKNEENTSFTNHTYPENKIKNTRNDCLSVNYTSEKLKINLNNTSVSNLSLYLTKTFNQSNVFNIQGLFLLDNGDYLLRCVNSTQQFLCKINNCNRSFKRVLSTWPSYDFYYSSFWLLFTFIATSSICYLAVCFVVDTTCYEIMDNKEKYGNQRLFGTIGWGLGAFVGGYLNQIIITDDSTTDYSLSFYLHAFLIVVGLIPVFYMKVEHVKYSSNICRDVCILLSDINLVIYLFMIFAIGVVSGLIWNYQFWFMEEIGSSQILLGLSQIAEGWFAELPCFLISGWVIKKLGYVNCNSLTLLCYGLRYLFFSYMQNPWMTLPLALISGPTYGIFFASMTMYGKTEAPPGTEATVQSVLAVVFEGAGCGIGSILGGIGFDTFGSRQTFFYTAIACFILLALNVICGVFVFKPRKKVSEKYVVHFAPVISH